MANADIVRLLLPRGVKVDHEALIHAAGAGNTAILKLLVDSGVDVGDSGALVEALREGQLGALKLLWDADNCFKLSDEILIKAAGGGNVALGHVEVVDMFWKPKRLKREKHELFREGADKAMIVAVRKGHTEVVRLLADNYTSCGEAAAPKKEENRPRHWDFMEGIDEALYAAAMEGDQAIMDILVGATVGPGSSKFEKLFQSYERVRS
ncbi:hypothetical protein HDV00_006001 [Rhizophlyctis rosea]|nr:hypothetical protein HDV00_006001 [Rhizophlyctis rosea]